MIAFKIEAEGYPPMFVKSVMDFGDTEATLGAFLCLPGEEDDVLTPGWQVTITAVEITQEELDAMPEWKM